MASISIFLKTLWVYVPGWSCSRWIGGIHLATTTVTALQVVDFRNREIAQFRPLGIGVTLCDTPKDRGNDHCYIGLIYFIYLKYIVELDCSWLFWIFFWVAITLPYDLYIVYNYNGSKRWARTAGGVLASLELQWEEWAWAAMRESAGKARGNVQRTQRTHSWRWF